jgi:hypothetical protein
MHDDVTYKVKLFGIPFQERFLGRQSCYTHQWVCTLEQPLGLRGIAAWVVLAGAKHMLLLAAVAALGSQGGDEQGCAQQR